MFSIVRIFISCVFLGCSIVVIKRRKAVRKYGQYAIFTGISVILTVVLSFLPFENLFVTFDSPQAAYEYYNLGSSNIELVLEGDACDFIVDRNNSSCTYLIIPKTPDGWKIGVGSNTKRIVQEFSNGISISVYQYKNTNDFFITVLDTNGGETTISDGLNTKFYSLEYYNEHSKKNFVTYYAHVSNFNPQYSITVNGTPIALGDQ